MALFQQIHQKIKCMWHALNQGVAQTDITLLTYKQESLSVLFELTYQRIMIFFCIELSNEFIRFAV